MTADFFQFRQQIQRPKRPAPAIPPTGRRPLSVSELTEKIRQVIRGGFPQSVLVQGEVSNLNRNNNSGHFYFTLKDSDACLDCVMFKSEAVRLKFQPTDGMELLAGGRIDVYPSRGRYQLYVSSLRPVGQGALELAFRQLKAKLEAEGLFAPERKKPIPRYPLRIVIVTSREAAALQDILKVLQRFSWLRLMLYPVPVQGEGAAQKIGAAIAHLNRSIDRLGGAELILLARGGGSLEDLWAFNEEIVARAVASSGIPIVTGIGHEVDVCIADLVADYHAHTPTEAAQVITANWKNARPSLDDSSLRLRRLLSVALNNWRQRLALVERHETFRRPMDRVNVLRQLLDDRERALRHAQDRRLRTARERLASAASRLDRFLPGVTLRFGQFLSDQRRRLDYAMGQRLRASHERLARAQALLQECHPKPRISLESQKLSITKGRLIRGMQQSVQSRSDRLSAMARHLEAVSPQAVLGRGYTITSRKKQGTPIRSAGDLKEGDKIVTRFADGEVESTVDDSKQMSLFD